MEPLEMWTSLQGIHIGRQWCSLIVYFFKIKCTKTSLKSKVSELQVRRRIVLEESEKLFQEGNEVEFLTDFEGVG